MESKCSRDSLDVDGTCLPRGKDCKPIDGGEFSDEQTPAALKEQQNPTTQSGSDEPSGTSHNANTNHPVAAGNHDCEMPTTSDRSSICENGNDQNNAETPKPEKARCDKCRKKLGLTIYQCRCGGKFCAVHRYSDKHECTFDYRAEGAEEIRRNNPTVVAEKIRKI